MTHVFKKRFSVVFLIIAILILSVTLYACNDAAEESPVEKIVISVQPKIEYNVKDTFDLKDAMITAYYESGKTETIPLTLEMISDFDSNTPGKKTLTVSYKNCTTYLTVTVVYPPLYAIKVNSILHKTEYVVGDALNVMDLTISAEYLNDYFETVAVTEDMISGFDTTTTGEKECIITYKNVFCSFKINVVKKDYDNLQLMIPTKRNYIVGDEIDFTGGEIFVSYNNNTSERLSLTELYAKNEIGVIIDNETTTTFTVSQLVATVKILYAGRTFDYTVQVSPLVADTVELSSPIPDQIKDSDAVDFSGGVLNVTFNNGKQERISFDDERVSIVNWKDFDLTRAGSYTITASITGVTIDCPVRVVNPVPQELVIVNDKTTIYQDEKIVPTEWQYSIKMNNGKLMGLTEKNEYYADVTEEMIETDLTRIDTHKVGVITISFKITVQNIELTATHEITVMKKEIVSVVMESLPDQIVYVQGEEPSFVGGTLRVNYNDGTYLEHVAITADMVVGDDDKSIELSTLTDRVNDAVRVNLLYIDVDYDSQAKTFFEIKVIKEAKWIRLVDALTPKKDYILGEKFDSSDWKVEVGYIDDTNAFFEDFAGSEWRFENTELETVGVHEVKLFYGYGNNVSLTFECTVTNKIARILPSTPFYGFVTEGKEIDLTKIGICFYRENGEYTFVNIGKDSCSYERGITYKHTATGYRSAFYVAKDIAYVDYKNGLWQQNAYFVKNENNAYVRASAEYDENRVYYKNVAFECKNDWNKYGRNFFVKSGDEYVRVAYNDSFNENTEYYLSLDNVYELQLKYEDKTVVVEYCVQSKTVTDFVVDSFDTEYVLGDKNWNIDEFSFRLSFDNDTKDSVSGDTEIHQEGNLLIFVTNGLHYELVIEKDGVIYEFAQMIAELNERLSQSEAEKFVSERIKVRLTECLTGNVFVSDEIEVHCFEQTIALMKAVIGEINASGDFEVYDSQTIFITKSTHLEKPGGLTDAYILENGSNDVRIVDDKDNGVFVFEHIYLQITYSDGAVSYVSLRAAMQSDTFGMSGYNTDLAGAQTITVSYLLKECSIALEVKDLNVSRLELSLTDGETIFVTKEGVALVPEDFIIRAYYVDADGNDVPTTMEIDLNDVKVNGYDVNTAYTFDKTDEVGNYALIVISVTYRGVSSNSLTVKVREKVLSRIEMNVYPKQVYIEGSTEPFDWGNASIWLIYDNGSQESVLLSDYDNRITKDIKEFNTQIELTDGQSQSQTIGITYNDGAFTQSTTFNIVVKDRKYLSVQYDNDLVRSYKFEYGTGESACPTYTVYYYKLFTDSEPVAMQAGSGKNGEYRLEFVNESNVVFTEWPTAVGTYKMRITYDGDAYNNPFDNADDTITISIATKEISVVVDTLNLTYGDVYDGNDYSCFGFVWELKGVKNGTLTDNPYCYSDDRSSVVKNISFRIVAKNKSAAQFTEVVLNAEGLKRFLINSPVGEYTVYPEIELKSDNYFISPLLATAESKLYVNRRRVIIVGRDCSKEYGLANPDFTYYVFDYKTIAEAYGEQNVASLDYESKVISGELKPLGYEKAAYYYVNEQNRVFDVSDRTFARNDLMYEDHSFASYRLTRERNADENVGAHNIYVGDNTLIDNYDVTYVAAELTITKALLYVGGIDAQRFYGTIDCDLTTVLTNQSFLRYLDTFEGIFSEYFLLNERIYYSSTLNIYQNYLPETENFDDWYRVYPNIKFYSDASLGSLSFEYKSVTFTLSGAQYTRNCSLVPIKAAAKEYFYQPDFSDFEHHDYDVSVYGYNKFNIEKVTVKINVKSFAVAERSEIKDGQARSLYEYFVLNGIDVLMLEKGEIDSKEYIDELFKNSGIIALEYCSTDGEVLPEYKLSEGCFTDYYSFRKAVKGDGIGIYKVNVECVSDNFVTELTSKVNSDVNYIADFYEKWSTKYEFGIKDTDGLSKYDTDAYVIVLPSYVDFDYGNGNRGVYSEVYSAKQSAGWAVETYFTTDKTNYDLYEDKNAIKYSIENAEGLTDFKMTAYDKYKAKMTYSIFDSDVVKYFYLGDTITMVSDEIIALLDYVFNGVTTDISHVNSFTYVVNPIEVDITIADDSYEYNGAERELAISVTNVLQGEENSFDYVFDIEAKFNMSESLSEYSDISYKELKSKLINAGDFTVKLKSTGNVNYTIKNSVSAKIKVLPINIPIYLKPLKDASGKVLGGITGSDGLTIEEYYRADTIEIIDFTDSLKNDNESSDFIFSNNGYGIVKKYFDENGNAITIALDGMPAVNLYCADEYGNYPFNAGRYDVKYALSTEFNNYDIIFVYKNSDNKYVVCDESHKYSLLVAPKEVMLVGYNERIAAKYYDGAEASISKSALNSLSVNDDYESDRIDPSKIKFVFTRIAGEGSNYISDGNERYTLVSDDDLRSVGEFKVEALYNDNYLIQFNEKGAYSINEYVDGQKRTFGKFVIKQKEILLSLNDVSSSKMNKEYDGFGLTHVDNAMLSGTFSDLNKYVVGGNEVLESERSSLLYMLDTKYYAKDYDATVVTVDDNMTNTYSYTGRLNGAESTYYYNVGYYWFNLRGVFEMTDGTYKRYADIDEQYSNWLSWNYTYRISLSSTTDMRNCDGIYEITARDVYFVFNPGSDVLTPGSAGVPELTGKDYNYSITYSGEYFYRDRLKNDINGKDDASYENNGYGLLNYGIYAYDIETQKFINIAKYNPSSSSSQYYLGNSSVLLGNYDFSKGLVDLSGDNFIYDTTSRALNVITDNLTEENSNFRIANASNDRLIRLSVKQYEIKIKIKVLNTDKLDSSGNPTASSIYGKSVSDSALLFIIEVDESSLDPNAPDACLASASRIIDEVIYTSGTGRFVVGDNGDFSVSFRYLNTEKTNYNGTEYYCTGGDWLVRMQTVTGAKSIPAGTYYVSGTELEGSYANKYKFVIDENSEFNIEKQEIRLKSLERTYYSNTPNDYNFIIGDENNPEALRVVQALKDYLDDKTSIAACVGKYETGNNYLVSIPKKAIRDIEASNTNYVIIVDDDYELNASSTSADYYLPLEITKRTITVDFIVTDDVEYGDRIEINGTTYSGFPSFKPDDPDYAQSILYRNELTNRFENGDNGKGYAAIINLQAIINEIATSAVNSYKMPISRQDGSGEYLYLVVPNDQNVTFDNYRIEWGNLVYKVVKKKISLKMEANARYHIDPNSSGNTETDYFSALWSERHDFEYSDSSDERLTFRLTADDFSINGKKYVDSAYGVTGEFEVGIGSKLCYIFGVTLNENNMYEKGAHTAATWEELFKILLQDQYIITDRADSSKESTSIGERFIRLNLKTLTSASFEFEFTPSRIALYPEAVGLGEYTDLNGNICDIITDSEAATDGVTVNANTKEISGLSMLVQINFNGVEQSAEYIDTKYVSKDDTYYRGMNYRRLIRVYYVSGASEESTTKITIRPGDIIEARIEYTETFYRNYPNAFDNTIESATFRIKFMESVNGNVSDINVIGDKTNGVIYNGNGVDEFASVLDGSEGEYRFKYRVGNVENTESKYDIVTVRARLTPSLTSGQNSVFETIVYDNIYGKLTLGMVSGSKPYYYVRMDYKARLLVKTNHTARVDGVTYYTLEALKEKSPEEGVVFEEGVDYYESIYDGYRLTEDVEPAEDKQYYVIKSKGNNFTSGCYVSYYECVISDSLVDVFNGSSHSINIYIDKLGELKDIVQYDKTTMPYLNGITIKKQTVAKKVYYVYVTVDNAQFVFSYLGGYYEYTESYGGYYINTTDKTPVAGKTYAKKTRVFLTKEQYDADDSSGKYYYVYDTELNRYVFSEEYDSSAEYFTIDIVNNVTSTEGLIELYEETDDKTVKTINPLMFELPGMPGFSYHNLRVVVSKFTIKTRLLKTVTTDNYIANVLLWPARVDEGKVTYIVNESTAENLSDSVKAAIDKVKYICISGGNTAAMGYFNTKYSPEADNFRITFTVDYGNKTEDDLAKPGLYEIIYSAYFNYFEGVSEQSVLIDSTKIMLYVTENQENEIKFDRQVTDKGLIALPKAKLSVDDNGYMTLTAVNEDSATLQFEKVRNIEGTLLSDDYADYAGYWVSGDSYIDITANGKIELSINGVVSEGDNVTFSGNAMTFDVRSGLTAKSTSPLLLDNTSGQTSMFYYAEGMASQKNLTYVMDNVTINDNGEIWLFLRTTTKQFTNLLAAPVDDVTSTAIGLRIVRYGDITLTTVYLTWYNHDDELNYVWFGGSTLDLQWTDYINIIKVDFADDDEDHVATIRIYQHDLGENATKLAWQQYIKRESFGIDSYAKIDLPDGMVIPQGVIYVDDGGYRLIERSGEVIDNGSYNYYVKESGSIGTNGMTLQDSHISDAFSGQYHGISLNNASLRLLDAYSGTRVNTDMDFAKYIVDGDIFNKGSYVSGDSVLTGEFAGDKPYIYMATDAYDVPYGYTENSMSIRFKADRNYRKVTVTNDMHDTVIPTDKYYREVYELITAGFITSGVTYYKLIDGVYVEQTIRNSEIGKPIDESYGYYIKYYETINPSPEKWTAETINGVYYYINSGNYVPYYASEDSIGEEILNDATNKFYKKVSENAYEEINKPQEKERFDKNKTYYELPKDEFYLLFGGNTPYYETVKEKTRQRGMMLNYNSNGELVYSFYIYRNVSARVTLMNNVDLYDGKEHTITITVYDSDIINLYDDLLSDGIFKDDTLNEGAQNLAIGLVDVYFVDITVDGITNRVVCPVYNKDYSDYMESIDSISGSSEPYSDKYFLKGMYYTGIMIVNKLGKEQNESRVKLSVLDFTTFNK